MNIYRLFAIIYTITLIITKTIEINSLFVIRLWREVKVMESGYCLADNICRYIGQTVTVFTNSGGASGCGFTGVLIAADCNSIKLLDSIGAAPSCPLGSNCCGYGNNWGSGNGCGSNCGCGCKTRNSCGCGNGLGYGNSYDGGYGYKNPLGAITEIPLCNIVSFTHNTIG